MFVKGSPLGIAIVAVSMALAGIGMFFHPTDKWAGFVLLFLSFTFFGLSRYLRKYLK